MVTGSGERLQVIHPGKENRDSGPDFLGAIIATDASGLLVGDVEIHRRVGDWRSHGHQHDPRYNGVILQVVWDGEASVALQNGGVVPTLSLRHCLAGSLDEVLQWAYLSLVPSEPCHGARQHLGDGVLGGLMDEAGEERFRLKVGRFAAMMHEGQSSQVLYRGVMGALGYTRIRSSSRNWLSVCL